MNDRTATKQPKETNKQVHRKRGVKPKKTKEKQVALLSFGTDS
jgi:hypothetical protein